MPRIGSPANKLTKSEAMASLCSWLCGWSQNVEEEKLCTSDNDEQSSSLQPRRARVSTTNDSWWHDRTSSAQFTSRDSDVHLELAQQSPISTPPRRREPSQGSPDPRHMTTGQLRRLLAERGCVDVDERASRSALLQRLAETSV